MQLKQFLWDGDIIRCYLFFIAEMYNLQFFASSLPHHVICANLPDFPGKLPYLPIKKQNLIFLILKKISKIFPNTSQERVSNVQTTEFFNLSYKA